MTNLKNLTRLAFLLTLLLNQLISSAQEINFEWGPANKLKSKKELSPEIIFADNNSVYLLRDNALFGSCAIEKVSTDNYESQFRVEISKALPSAAKRKFDFARIINDKIALISYEVKSNVYKTYVSLFDLEGQVIEASKEIDEFKQAGKNSMKGYSQAIVSPSQSYMVLLREEPAKEKDDNLTIVVKYFDGEFNETSSKRIEFAYKKAGINFSKVALDNSGNLIMLCTIDPSKTKNKKEDKKAKKSKDKEAAIFVLPYDKEELQEMAIPIKEKAVINSLYFVFDKEFNFHLSGYYGAKSGASTNFFIAQMNPLTNEVVRNVDVPVKGLKSVQEAQKNTDKKSGGSEGDNNSQLVGFIKEIYFGEDGSYTVISELNYMLLREYKGQVNEIHCSEDIYVSRISSEGKLLYTTIVPKLQAITTGITATTSVNAGGGTSFNSRSGMSSGGGGGIGGLVAGLAVGLAKSALQNAMLEQQMVAAKKSIAFLSHSRVFYGNKVALIFNDNPKNVKLVKGKVARLRNIAKSNTFMIVIDEKGKAEREVIASNKKSKIILMPANYYRVSDKKYIVYSSLPGKGIENIGVMTID